jgi:oxygen-independent coproporphyrinogen-3 oxidase
LVIERQLSASLYLHVPFCKTRCSYCSFNTYAGIEDRIEDYVAALRREIELVGASIEGAKPAATTLYLGGGTPSLLTPKQIAALLETCHRCFDLPDGAEISMEATASTT